MKILFGIIVSIFIQFNASALVSCGPSSCTPACGSTCTYSTCTNNQSQNFTVDKVPFNDFSEPSNACSYTRPTINQVPFTVSGTTYNQVPANVTLSYRICQTRTNTGPPCPPSP